MMTPEKKKKKKNSWRALEKRGIENTKVQIKLRKSPEQYQMRPHYIANKNDCL